MSHPEHECADCGFTHMSYTAHKEFAEKQENCKHDKVTIKCIECKKELGVTQQSNGHLASLNFSSGGIKNE